MLKYIVSLSPAIVVDAADGEVEVNREDVALQGHAVADFDVVLRRDVLADDASGPVGDEGLLCSSGESLSSGMTVKRRSGSMAKRANMFFGSL